MDIQKIYEDALRDPTLFAQLDVDAILDSLENTSNDYLENKNLESIQRDILHRLQDQRYGRTVIQTLSAKLADYRYVDEIRDLHKGKHVRWIRMGGPGEPKLTNGGIVVDIKFLDNGTHILTKNNQHRFVQYKFDDCITFQKLSMEEQLILMAYDFMNRMEP
jgi:hypothetical protein